MHANLPHNETSDFPAIGRKRLDALAVQCVHFAFVWLAFNPQSETFSPGAAPVRDRH